MRVDYYKNPWATSILEHESVMETFAAKRHSVDQSYRWAPIDTAFIDQDLPRRCICAKLVRDLGGTARSLITGADHPVDDNN